MATAVLPPSMTITDKESLNTYSEKPKVFTNPTIQVNFRKVDKSNLCVQCGEVLINAYQLPCGHDICEKDYEKIKIQSVISCPFECEEPCIVKQIRPDVGKRRDVSKLQVHCQHEERGCKEVIAWQHLEKHLETCPYQQVECSNTGCGSTVLRKNREDHEMKKCNFRPELCSCCKQNYPSIKKKEHQEKECPKYLIHCIHKCDIHKMPREKMDRHSAVCPNKQMNCSFAFAGCAEKGTKRKLESHTEKSTAVHLRMLFYVITTLYSKVLEEIDDTKKVYDAMKGRHENSLLESRAVLEELSTLSKEVKATEKTIKDIKLHINKKEKRIETISSAVKNSASKADVDLINRDITIIKDTSSNISSRISELQKYTSNGQSGALEKKIQQTFALLETRLSELSLRCDIFQASRYDGVLIWKICNYKHRKLEAASGQTLSLFSQPFYSSVNGYKMCARAYLNGDGIGKGSHLSFFFIVMKGDHDVLLPWPFKQKVSLMLMSQGGSNQNKCDTFIPDPHSNSFQKPVTEMNIASGIPQFISHRELETPKYLQDDTIFLKIRVDTSNIFASY